MWQLHLHQVETVDLVPNKAKNVLTVPMDVFENLLQGLFRVSALFIALVDYVCQLIEFISG